MGNKVQRNRNILILCLTLIGLLGVLLSTGLFIRDAVLETLSVETKAKILSVGYTNGQRYATVTYRVEKLDYVLSTPLEEAQENLMVNDLLDIKYDVRNPGKAIYNDHLMLVTIGIIVSTIIIIITGPKASKVLTEYKLINTLKETGIRINATITDIYVDTTAPIHKKQFPYRIRAKYTNPVDNKEYVYDSNYTYVNLKEKQVEYQTENIAVYLDKNNTSRYYVDLDSMKESDE